MNPGGASRPPAGPEVTALGAAYIYATLRILFGLLGCVYLVGLSDLATFWDPAGLIRASESGLKGAIIGSGWGPLAGRAIFFGNLLVCVLMTVGYRTTFAVAAAFAGATLHAWWNPLPLSGAFEVRLAILFCLMWSACGVTWSVDAWLAGRRPEPTPLEDPSFSISLWPLWMIRVQVAVIYLSTGLWKLGGEQWRHGTALHYVLNNNGFARFPSPPPAAAAPLLISGTYITLLWELAFPVLVVFRHTRALALGLGVLLHVGMWLTLELGPFSWMMLATYVSFLDPSRVGAYVLERGLTAGPIGELKSSA